MPEIKIELETSYLEGRDVTIVWQLMRIDEDVIQETIVGWYHGEPDSRTTEQFSHLNVMAQYF